MHQKFITWLQQRTTASFHRELLSLSLPFDEAILYCEALINIKNNCWLLSNHVYHDIDTRLNIKTCEQAKIKSVLGMQCDAIIFDARIGIDLNALYAASGLVSHSGIIMLLLPNNFESHIQHYDPIRFSFNDTSPTPNFIEKYFRSIVERGMPYISKNKLHLPLGQMCSEFELQKTANIQLSYEQKSIQSTIVNTACSNTKHLILGARGRGKSTLLGAIAYEFMAQGKQLVITAPNKQQIVEIEKQYTLQCESHNNATNPLTFLAPDQCCSNIREANILLIDEVASIAPTLIQEMINTYNIVILSGTTNGYEGSGQGFVQRVLPYIQEHYPCTINTLNKPFRWQPNDPVEAFFDAILCADKAQYTLSQSSVEQKQSTMVTPSIEWLDKQILLSDDAVYQQVFQLLQSAHYQTSPNDIVRVLDASDHIIGIASIKTTTGKQIIGVVLGIIEGGRALQTIAKDISRGHRRVQGHLSPQSLALSINEATLCSLQYLRVTRIAVAKQFRRQNVGSLLLDYCFTWAGNNGYDCVSTSFGLTDTLLSFWLSNHFSIAKMGNRIDTSSGTSSVMLVRTINGMQEHINALQAQVIIDTQFYHFLYTELKGYANANRYLQVLSGEIIANELNQLQEHTRAIDLLSRIEKSLDLYLKSKIRFQNVASVIYANALHFQNTYIVELIRRYFTKGQHKLDKVKIETELKTILTKR